MKQSILLKKVIVSAFCIAAIIYFMLNTTSPKIIFVPFLICAVSMAGRCVALLVHHERVAGWFHMAFVGGFFLFWFGFLTVVAYICIRDKKLGMLAFSIPFWLVGVVIARNILRRNVSAAKKREKADADKPFLFSAVVTAILVCAVLLAGIVLLVLGFRDNSAGVLFGGAFFLFGGGAFVIGALTVHGTFDQLKVDVLGIYMSVVVVGFGIGAVALKCMEHHSLVKAVEEFGLWIIIPAVMILGGVAGIVSFLKNRKS